jgi:hypothetical protein
MIKNFFSFKNLSKFFIIFFVGFLSRYLILKFSDINVVTEFWSYTSLLYYTFFSAFIVLVHSYFDCDPSGFVSSNKPLDLDSFKPYNAMVPKDQNSSQNRSPDRFFKPYYSPTPSSYTPPSNYIPPTAPRPSNLSTPETMTPLFGNSGFNTPNYSPNPNYTSINDSSPPTPYTTESIAIGYNLSTTSDYTSYNVSRDRNLSYYRPGETSLNDLHRVREDMLRVGLNRNKDFNYESPNDSNQAVYGVGVRNPKYNPLSVDFESRQDAIRYAIQRRALEKELQAIHIAQVKEISLSKKSLLGGLKNKLVNYFGDATPEELAREKQRWDDYTNKRREMDKRVALAKRKAAGLPYSYIDKENRRIKVNPVEGTRRVITYVDSSDQNK